MNKPVRLGEVWSRRQAADAAKAARAKLRNATPVPSVPAAFAEDRTVRGFFVEKNAPVDVSVLLGTVDRLEMLQDCVKHIRSSVGDLRYEIVIAYGAKDEPALPWMYEQPDIVPVLGGMDGAIEAFNRAYDASRGRFVCQINDDVLIDGDAIARAVRHLQADPSSAGVIFKFKRGNEPTYRYENLGEGRLHPNQMVVRRSTCEAVIEQIGAFWGDAAHRTDKTYGGDSAFGVMCHHLGLRLDGVEGVTCRDLLAQDDLRTRNKVAPKHFERWRAMYQPFLNEPALPRTRDPERIDRVRALDLVDGQMPPRCEPRAERVLHLHLETADDPQAGLVRALSGLGEYTQIDWQKARDAGKLEAAMLAAAHRLRPTLVFMQLHGPWVSPETIAKLRPLLAPSGVIATWCGDVAGKNSPWSVDWQVPLGRAVDLTLHSSLTHVRALRTADIPGAAYLQIGYDREQYKPAPDVEKIDDVCFLGNRYYSAQYLQGMKKHDAPLRDAVIAEMKRAFGPRFALYGSGHAGHPQIHLSRAHEAYHRSKIGLNVSLCNFFESYSSDRIFRILGCGALLLTKRFPLMSTYGLIEGESCVGWDTPAEAVALAKKYASPEHAAERERIAAAGARLALESHTWESRMHELAALLAAVRGGK